MLRWPVEPMRAASAATLPTPARTSGSGLRYEPKWDGWRLVAWCTEDGVQLQSRAGKPLTQLFPDLCDALARHMPVGTLLDGEALSWDVAKGRTSFANLRRRITAGRGLAKEVAERPAHFVIFDVLQEAGMSLLREPLSQRRQRLERLLSSAPPQLPLCPQTDDEQTARTWLADWSVAAVEGLVVKRSTGLYRPGKIGWTKIKNRSTTEFVVGGVTGTVTQPDSLLLGRFDQAGVLRHMAQTVPLTATQRRDVAGLLQPMPFQGDGCGHPWPCPLPAAWLFDSSDRQPLRYVQVEPTAVAEVDVDAAVDPPGRWRHRQRFVRTRVELPAVLVPRWGPDGDAT